MLPEHLYDMGATGTPHMLPEHLYDIGAIGTPHMLPEHLYDMGATGTPNSYLPLPIDSSDYAYTVGEVKG